MVNKLKKILNNVEVVKIIGKKNAMFKNIRINSNLIKSKDIYVALIGVNTDGHIFVNKAINKGAAVIVSSKIPEKTVEGITYVIVKDTSEIVGVLFNNFYDNVTSKIKLVGVTGTNGKTSITTLSFNLFKKLGYKTGLISTITNIIDNKKVKTDLTTPDVATIYDLLNKMYLKGCEYVFMECSSHAIEQKRISGLKFSVCLFSNITQDHLDYHKTFKEYIKSKKNLFDKLSKSAFAISNLDDRNGKIMLQNTEAKKVFYSLKTITDIKGRIISNDIKGLTLQINQNPETTFKLIGEFNAYNLLAVYSIAVSLQQDPKQILLILSTLNAPEGRFDKFISPNKKICAIVDYAHTPDALKKVLTTLNKIKTKEQGIFTVIGCGGNRDKTKRPLMAQIGYKHSNFLVFSSDNPRDEDPKKIIKDMKVGLTKEQIKKTKTIEDREKAIEWALNKAKPGDIVLVSGKGHEKYQEIKGKKTVFSDKESVKKIFKTNNY